METTIVINSTGQIKDLNSGKVLGTLTGNNTKVFFKFGAEYTTADLQLILNHLNKKA